MLVGRKVNIQEPFRLKIFYPDYRVVNDNPLFQGKYIYVSNKRADFERHSNMIWVSKFNPDIDLEQSANLLTLLKHFKKTPKNIEEYLLNLDDVRDMWDKIRSFYVFGILPEAESEARVFDLFKVLNKADKVIYSTYRRINMPFKVLVSSIVTMLVKSQNIEEVRSTVSRGYLRILFLINQTLKDVPAKLAAFYHSGRSELDFVQLLFNLKR